MPKILVLPGYLQSAKLFAEKSSGIRKLLTKQDYQLDYVDPPYVIATPDELPFQLSTDEAECETKWKYMVEAGNNRCWWQHDDEVGYTGFESSFKYIQDYIKQHGPYDGIMGFSQGAAMSAIVVNYMAQIDQSFKVAILFSGFAFTMPSDNSQDRMTVNYETDILQDYIPKIVINPMYLSHYSTQSVKTHIFNIFGAQDLVVPAVRSKYLGSLYGHVQNFPHDGGHMVPNKKPFVRPLIDGINEALTKYNL